MDYLIQTQFFWHLSYAFVGMIGGFIIMNYLTKIKSLQFIVPFFTVLLIGLGYELIQGKSHDTGTDMAANFIGLFIGIIVLVAYDKLVK